MIMRNGVLAFTVYCIKSVFMVLVLVSNNNPGLNKSRHFTVQYCDIVLFFPAFLLF